MQFSATSSSMEDLIKNYITIVSLQYWLIARKFVYEYEGVSEAHPRFLFAMPAYVLLFKKDEDNTLKTKKWTNFYKEATTHDFNTFLFRVLLHYGMPEEEAIKWCSFNIAKQPHYLFSVRNFTELLMIPEHMQRYLGLKQPPLLSDNRTRFPRNMRYQRVEVEKGHLPRDALPFLVYTHRRLAFHDCVLNISDWKDCVLGTFY